MVAYRLHLYGPLDADCFRRLYPNHCDITNNYIKEGVHGGLLRMILFISIIVFCFKFLGAALRKIRTVSL